MLCARITQVCKIHNVLGVLAYKNSGAVIHVPVQRGMYVVSFMGMLDGITMCHDIHVNVVCM